MKIDIGELTSNFLSKGLSGEEVDLGIQTLTGELLNKPILDIEIFKTDEFIILLQNCNKYFIYPISLKEFYFTAFYNITETAPIPRCYFMRKNYIEILEFLILMQKYGFNFFYISDIEFSEIIEENTFEDRKQIFLKEKEKKYAYLKKYLEGRKTNTTLQNTMLLNSKYCLSCKDELANNLLSTTIAIPNKSTMIMYNVCPRCVNLAKNFNGSNIEFLMRNINIKDEIFKTEAVSNEELFKRTINYFKNDLKCKNIAHKMKDEQYEVTAFRKSGIKIIFRMQGANQEKINYAYMLYDKHDNSKQLIRYDSANHHNDKLISAPDHIHYDLKKGNNHIKSSFITGFLDLDLPEIKRKIKELEQSY